MPIFVWKKSRLQRVKAKMNIRKKLILLIFALGSVVGAKCQDVGIKTNLLADGLLSPNVGLEIGLAPKWSLDLTGQINFWDVNNHKWKHWLAQPEARYWFCDHFSRHFLGVHALGGMFNFGQIKNNSKFLGTDFSPLTDNRYQGWAVGAGIAYGYSFILGLHWNLELELGVGYAYVQFDKFECVECGRKLGDGHHHYVGPTKAAVNLVYVF